MEFRKLIGFGRNSYVVSMPKSWVNKNNLKKGDMISVSEGDEEIVLVPNSFQNRPGEARESIIETTNKDLDMIKAEIISSYLNNYDSIRVNLEGLQHDVMEIKSIVMNLAGLEIMEQTSRSIVAKDIVNLEEINLIKIIRRIDVIVRGMISDTMSCLNKACPVYSIVQRDADINRLYYLGYRAIKRALKNPRVAKLFKLTPWQLYSCKMVMLRLEKIADRQKRIARYLQESDMDAQTTKELTALYGKMNEAFLEAMKAFYNNDKATGLRMDMSNKERTRMCDEFLKNTIARSIKKKHSIEHYVALAKIAENLKAMSTSVRNIGRTIATYD